MAKRSKSRQNREKSARPLKSAKKQGKPTMAKKKVSNGEKAQPEKRPIVHYDHKDKTRVNNPPVGLVTPQTDPDPEKKKTYQYDPHLDPQLVWAGKAERCSFQVPTVSLHVHERIDPRTIIRAVQKRNGDRSGSPSKPVQRSLFEEPQENPPLREAIDFYRHAHGWSNRLIAGDSLMVMNSLLEKEGMAGKVQMVYIDPPYGIRYRSNFQPFVNRREMGETDKDEDLTQEPEMIQAFRDTWEVGIHSYLTSLRDRLLLSRELLTDSGSCFVQISDENVHLVRGLMDEVFGVPCHVVLIPVKKKGSQKSGLMDPVNDYLIWYTKKPRRDGGDEAIKFRPLFERRELNADTIAEFKFVELPDGREFMVSDCPNPKGDVQDYRLSPRQLLTDYPGARLFRSNPMTSGGVRKNQSLDFVCNGRKYSPGKGNCWKTTVQTDDGSTPGMDRLAMARRLIAQPGQLRFKSYMDDFGYVPISNWWDGLGGASSPIYVVQTNTEIIRRCMLMTTDPGDLVLDPTCGSGTTAFVAEQLGRRWITCDSSRVAVALAKQRLMTSLFEFFDLLDPGKGVGGGFRYKKVPHVTLGAIANNPEIQEGLPGPDLDALIKKYAPPEPLYSEPEVDSKKARVTGPFTLEAVPAPAVRPVTEIVVESKPVNLDAQAALPGLNQLEAQSKLEFTEDVSVARYGETLRQRQRRDELLACGIRAKGGKRIEFSRLEPLGAARWLQCEGETKGDRVERVVVSFGPEYAPLEQRQVELALEEAVQLKPTPKIVVFAAFQFDPEAAKDIDETKWPGVTLLKVQMNTDLLTDDLKKKRASNESYWLMGQPDVELRQVKKGENKGKWEVEIHGFDYFNPRTGAIESGDTSRIAMWMLDTDYDGRSLFPRQVFFPMAGPKDGWARLAKNLKAEIDDELIEAYRGTVSLPFEQGDYKRAAVKIVDDRGIESLKIVEIG